MGNTLEESLLITQALLRICGFENSIGEVETDRGIIVKEDFLWVHFSSHYPNVDFPWKRGKPKSIPLGRHYPNMPIMEIKETKIHLNQELDQGWPRGILIKLKPVAGPAKLTTDGLGSEH